MAANYVSANYGGMNKQFDTVMGGKSTSNAIVNVANGKQAGGRRSRRRRSRKSRCNLSRRKRRGGNLPLVLGESMAPLALFGAQHYYNKRIGSRHTRRNPFHFKRRR
jgi:hypothetical protein